jgi:hypothetical protein
MCNALAGEIPTASAVAIMEMMGCIHMLHVCHIIGSCQHITVVVFAVFLPKISGIQPPLKFHMISCWSAALSLAGYDAFMVFLTITCGV